LQLLTLSLALRNTLRRFFAWYGVNGIFLDEGSNDCAQLPYYQAIIAAIKTRSPSATTVLNHGTDGPECFLSQPNTPDILLSFENTYTNYVAWPGPPVWTVNYNVSRSVWRVVPVKLKHKNSQPRVCCIARAACRFWHLVHSTPATPEAFYRAITLSKDRRAGNVYITDDNMAAFNPW
jgi:hypothetical protein